MIRPYNPQPKGNPPPSLPPENSQNFVPCPDRIAPLHWQEWIDSGIHPELIGANLRSLDADTPYEYLCYADGLPRTNSGRLATHILRRYAHTEAGGWWCQGLDPLNDWAPMPWGCFKPDTPRTDSDRGKTIKYEHPLKTPTRAFFLDDPRQPDFWANHQADPSQPILLVEGAKKAAALLSRGYAAIALPGVFNGRRVMRDEWGKVYSESLIPELAHFAHPGRPVYFCFDSDTKASTRRLVDLAIGTTGKLLQDAGCDVRVIDLPGPEKGVDDFLVAQGDAAFQARYEAALPLALWQWQGRKQAELTHIPTQIVHQAEFRPTNLPADGILVLASAKGTGKTKAIVDLVQGDARILALGHRISLMRNLCDRMDLDYRSDLDEFRGQAINAVGVTHRVGLCVDSLGKINPDEFRDGIVVIDEFMQVLRHLLLSQTCNQNGKRPALLARLGQVVRNARLVILADADAADIGIDYFRALRGGDQPVHLIRNDFQPEGFPVRFLAAKQDDPIVAEILEDISAGRKIFVATDSLNGSEALKQLIDNLKSAPRGLIINSKTSGEPEQRDFITNPNQTVQQYDWILATPSLSTGVSIEVEHFEKVYGLFYGVTTDADAAQALNRVRANVPRIVWSAKQGKNFSPMSRSTQPRAIAQVLKHKTDLTAQVIRASLGCPDMLLPELFDAVWQQNPHITLFTQLVARTNQSLWMLREGLLARLHHEGNTIQLVEPNATADSPMKTARQQVKQAHFEAVAQATILSQLDREKLERQEALSPTDQLDIEKTQAADFLALDEVTAADVAFSIQYRSLILQLEVLLHGQDLAIHRDLDALTRQTQWGHGFLPFDQPFYELKRFVRDRLGLMPYLDPEATWSDADLQPLGDMVRGHRQQVQEILGFTVPADDKHASNGWVFQMMCQQLGFKVKSQRRGGRGAQERYFSLDREHYQQLMAIVDRRQARRLAAIVAIDPEFLSETVVTPVGLNQMDRGNYGVKSDTPELSLGNQLETVSDRIPIWEPNRFIGRKAFEVISDRVRRQVDMAIGGLRLAMMGKPIGLES
jgi:Domain of unknown function (DUF3854)/Origin of replication binding protein